VRAQLLSPLSAGGAHAAANRYIDVPPRLPLYRPGRNSHSLNRSSVEAVLSTIGYSVALAVEAIAIVIIATGAVEAVANIIRIMRAARVSGVERRAVWLDFAGWLVAALTFQLAADIISTSFSPSWDQVGRLGAIAAIRTFLSYFLDREVESTRRLQDKRPSWPLHQTGA
jgi:uncharacterized membrane protein